MKEGGAFSALKTGDLQALQVYVHPDIDARERVLETYTFKIKYTDHDEHGRQLAGLGLDSPSSSYVSVGATNASLQDFFRELIDVCKELPDLPGTTRFVRKAFYRSS